MSRLPFRGWEAEVVPAGEGRFRVAAGGEAREVRLLGWSGGLLDFEVDGRVVSAAVEVGAGRVEVVIGGRRAAFPLEDAPAEPGAGGFGPGPLRAELPGRVLDVRVAGGDVAAPGEVLLLVEAMKMEHALRAGAPVRVVRVAVSPGDQIAPGDLLMELAAPEEKEEEEEEEEEEDAADED